MAFKFPPENWQVLLNPERQEWQSVDEFVRVVKPSPDQVWADVGCGPGYFTLPLARSVKKVYAVDLEEPMLEVCKERAEEEGLENVEFLRCSECNVPLPDESVDMVLMANLIHELESPDEFLRDVGRSLKEGGKVIVIDWHPVPSPAGPPIEERIPKEEAIKIMERNSYRLVEDHEVYPYHYFLVFRKA